MSINVRKLRYLIRLSEGAPLDLGNLILVSGWTKHKREVTTNFSFVLAPKRK